MAALNYTNTWFQSQSKSLKTVFDKTNPQVPLLYPQWLNTLEGDADRSFFQVLPFYGFGLMGLKMEGAAPLLDQGGEGTPSMFPYTTWGLQYGVTMESRLEDPYRINGRLPRFLRYSEDQTKEQLLWNILNQAFSTNAAMAIWDGLPLCSTAHVLSGTPGVTYSNSLGATALTPETLQQAFILMETLPDDRNLATFRTPKQIIAPPGLQRVIEEILGSAYYPYSDENRVNVVQDKVEPLIVRYLNAPATGPFPWFVSAGKGDLGSDAHASFASFKFQHQQHVWYDDATGNMYHKTEFRGTWGSVDGRGLVGSQGA